MTYYHVMSDLETRFRSLDEVMAFVADPVVSPRVPRDRMPGEDASTPRICVTPSVEACVDALKPFGRFRRCLDANPDAKSYENGGEAYPVVVLEFPDGTPCVRPDPALVPDAGKTGELWITGTIRPEARLEWLGARSVVMDGACARCVRVDFLSERELRGKHHPWLDGKGHPLESGQYGWEPWPGLEPFLGPMEFLGYEDRLWHRTVVAKTESSGFSICRPYGPVEPWDNPDAPDSYRAMTEDVKPFTGAYDRRGRMLFLDDTVLDLAHGRRLGRVCRDGGWTVEWLDGSGPDSLADMLSGDGRPRAIGLELVAGRTQTVT